MQLVLISGFLLFYLIRHPSLWLALTIASLLAGASLLFGWLRRARVTEAPDPATSTAGHARERLRALLRRMENRLDPAEVATVQHFIQEDELPHAMKALLDGLQDTAQPITNEDRAEMLAVGQLLQVGQYVRRALRSLP